MLKIKSLKLDKLLLLILLVGFLFRVVGSNHGFPFIFHPDEAAVVRSATGIRFDSNPAHFDWPHLHFYLNFFLYMGYIKFRGLLQILGLQSTLASWFPLMWRDPLIFYFLSRLFNVFLGTLTAVPVYLAGKTLFNRKTGLFAALALMLTPYHVYVSTFALIDIPTAFWVAWGFYFSAKIFKSNDLKNYLWAGLFVGLAASTKYNGGLMALMVPTAHFLRTWRSSTEKILDFQGFKVLVLSGFLAFLGFVIGTPYAVLDYDTFSRTDSALGAYWQFTNVGKVPLADQIIQFVEELTIDNTENFGYVFLIFYFITLFTAFGGKDRRKLWMILAPSLFLFFYISGFDKTRAHYYLSAYPFVALSAGYVFSSLSDKVLGAKGTILIVLLFSIPLWFSFQRTSTLVKTDTRQQLYTWMQEEVTIADNIYYTSSSLLPVIEKFSVNISHKDINDLQGSGYLIVSLANDEEREFELGISEYTEAVKDLDKVKVFDDEGRRGPYLAIYAF